MGSRSSGLLGDDRPMARPLSVPLGFSVSVRRERGFGSWLIATLLASATAAGCAAEPRPDPVEVPPPPPSEDAASAGGVGSESGTPEEGAPQDPAPSGPGPLERARADNARADAQSIAMAVELWRASHPDVCPTFDDLVRDKVMDPKKKNADPWGQPYAIQCTESGLSITSNGPDEAPGTGDDIAHDR